ncbi:MAG: sulfotransferase [Cyclobacteriaceae bacterium]|nr:sulfotransferase [Cyclobacteriaceae bacterium]
MSKFRLPPISPLLGSNILTYIKSIGQGRIEPRYYLKTVLTFLIVLIGTPFRWYDGMIYHFFIRKKKDPVAPVFIIGHWRSGTTFLHNILCQDSQIGFVTTYQSVFPNNLASKLLFRGFMKSRMPKTRPGDNVQLSVGYPQEDEFALSNMNPHTFYQFMYFPENFREFYSWFIRFESRQDIVKDWKADYKKMIKKACHETGGSIPVLKNPCNTGRIKILLEMYPDAKFIHIVRNPVVVFLSARKFFTELLPTLWFHRVGEKFIEEIVFEIYEFLMNDFLALKEMIPPQNLIEIRFEDLEEDPMFHLESIYKQFALPGFGQAESHFSAYLNKMAGYRKNRYQVIDEEVVGKINRRWGFAMDLWDYHLPDNLKPVKKEAAHDHK